MGGTHFLQTGYLLLNRNAPFERTYGCMTIVKNVLDSVPAGTTCAFILPDKKLEKDLLDKKYGNKVLKDHRLTTIVKLPEKTFSGVTASIFAVSYTHLTLPTNSRV